MNALYKKKLTILFIGRKGLENRGCKGNVNQNTEVAYRVQDGRYSRRRVPARNLQELGPYLWQGQGRPSCNVCRLLILRLEIVISPSLVSYNLYGGNQDLKSVFGDVDRFLR